MVGRSSASTSVVRNAAQPPVESGSWSGSDAQAVQGSTSPAGRLRRSRPSRRRPARRRRIEVGFERRRGPAGPVGRGRRTGPRRQAAERFADDQRNVDRVAGRPEEEPGQRLGHRPDRAAGRPSTRWSPRRRRRACTPSSRRRPRRGSAGADAERVGRERLLGGGEQWPARVQPRVDERGHGLTRVAVRGVERRDGRAVGDGPRADHRLRPSTSVPMSRSRTPRGGRRPGTTTSTDGRRRGGPSRPVRVAPAAS